MQSAYMLHLPVTVVQRQGARDRLVQLPEGAIFYAENRPFDRAIMVAGTCNGNAILMFSRDLDECTTQMPASRGAVVAIR